MSFNDDLGLQAQAVELAREALLWLRRHDTITAMEKSDEVIFCTDYGERAPMLWYTQRLEGDGVKFGHAIMREGQPRHASAAACDIHMNDNVHWVLCGISDAYPGPTTSLAPHAGMDSMVHEATHYLDFKRSNHKPRSFQPDDIAKLSQLYYNKPHEMNAFFHQGLFLFMSDLFIIKAILQRFGSDNVAHRHYLRSSISKYWRADFVNSLTWRNRRRFTKRVFRAFTNLLRE